jgi:molecular chaperone DnaK
VAGYSLGIDLGTTFSAAAVAREGRAEIVPLGNRAAAIPSVLFFGEDGQFKVGDAAIPRGISASDRFAREFKRRLGDPTPLVVGGTAWSPEALMGELLRHVFDATAEREGGPAERLALTHPANWGSFKLDLLTQAVRLAGLRVDRYLSEPEAAAFAYAAAAADRLPTGALIAVYDLGGGTFDATVLRTRADGFEILGNPEGIERLGGIDVDQMVLSHVHRTLGPALDELDRTDPSVLPLLARLRADCIDAKEQLSNDTEVVIPVTLPGAQTEVRLTRTELESMIAPPLEQTIGAMRRALDSADVLAADLHAVLLVGGTSRIPLVADLVASALGRPVTIDSHPKHCVAIGAALAAERNQAPQIAAALSIATVAQAEPLEVERVERPGEAVEATPAPAPPSDAPAAAPAPTSVPSMPAKQTKLLIGVVVALAIVVAGLVGVLIGGSGNSSTLAITSPPGVVPPTGVVACPADRSAVCIDAVSIRDGQLVADFAAQGATLAATSDGRTFPDNSVHPVFFFDTEGPEQGRNWGPRSPFAGTNEAGLQAFTAEEVPAGSNLCVVLADENGMWQPDTGNCVPAPGT